MEQQPFIMDYLSLINYYFIIFFNCLFITSFIDLYNLMHYKVQKDHLLQIILKKKDSLLCPILSVHNDH